LDGLSGIPGKGADEDQHRAQEKRGEQEVRDIRGNGLSKKVEFNSRRIIEGKREEKGYHSKKKDDEQKHSYHFLRLPLLQFG
jgi:dsRNA-specific ribonuclease